MIAPRTLHATYQLGRKQFYTVLERKAMEALQKAITPVAKNIVREKNCSPEEFQIENEFENDLKFPFES